MDRKSANAINRHHRPPAHQDNLLTANSSRPFAAVRMHRLPKPRMPTSVHCLPDRLLIAAPALRALSYERKSAIIRSC
jgi:hypothetical protein